MTPGNLRGRVTDVVLAVVVLGVPLGFSDAMRTFAAAKLAVLEVGVAVALVVAGFMGGWRSPPRAAIAAACVIAIACAMRPDVEGLASAGYLGALVALAALVAWRSDGVGDARLVQILGAPLALGLALSLAQSLGFGVLTATRMSFGETHGVAVGTIGNPVENTWWLVLAVAMLAGLAQRRLLVVAIVLVAIVIVVDRARASAVVGAGALAIVLLRSKTPWLRWAAIAITGAAFVAVFVWGGTDALRGRGVLLAIGAKMVLAARGIPRGPGAFARDFEEAERAHHAVHPHDAQWASILDHAHCDPIEWVYETGVLGIVAMVALAVAITRRLRVDPTPRRRAAVTTLAIAAVLGIVGYPLFSVATGTLMAVAVGLALAPVPVAEANPTTHHAWWHAATRGLAVVSGVGLLVLAQRQATSELAITRALIAHAEDDDRRGLHEAQLAVAHFGSADAWFYLGNFEQRVGDCPRATAAWLRSMALRPREATRRNLARCNDAAVAPADAGP